MPPSKAAEPSAKRCRTDAQLAQKRQADKVKHRSNRAESKTRLESIERDVSFLRDTISELLVQMRPRPALPEAAVSSLGQFSHQYSHHEQLQSSPSENNAPVSQFINTWLEHAGSHQYSTTAAPVPANTFVTPQKSPSISSSPSSQQTTLVDCRCGLQHGDQSECLELKSFTVLYESHKALSQSPLFALSIARNPTLPNMLLHSTNDSPLTMLIGTTLRQFQARNVETLCGLYLLVYRLLRWRMYPNPDWYHDVPILMRPTEVQNTHLHPVCIDFLPWPALRDYLCQNQNKDSRHSVDLYMRSIQLHWPPEKPLLCTDPGGAVELHPDFEATVCDAQSWTLVSPWAEAFEHLKMHVH
ncbi:bZIP transcription factor, partial [Metarhizium majus ARSEF 297]